MAKVTRFEELIAWQKARGLTKHVYELTRDPSVARDFGFCSQIQRASVSVISNIAEGFERATPKDFAQFLNISKSSCAELRSLSYVGIDVNYFSRAEYNLLLPSVEEVGRIIGGLRNSILRRCP